MIRGVVRALGERTGGISWGTLGVTRERPSACYGHSRVKQVCSSRSLAAVAAGSCEMASVATADPSRLTATVVAGPNDGAATAAAGVGPPHEP
jgi:hypothetical protein